LKKHIVLGASLYPFLIILQRNWNKFIFLI
jgi:hypothetical protein